MRISNSTINRRALTALQNSLRRMDEAHARVSSGLRVEKPSDDPGATVGILHADRRLRALDQYRRNISTAQSRLGAEEAVLDQLTDVLSRARELATGQVGGTADATTRATVKVEVDQLIEQVIMLGNTNFAGTYLFGGAFADDKPFADDGTTSTDRPPAGGRMVEIGAGQTIALNHDAVEAFVDSGVIESLQRLSNGLGANSNAEVGASLNDLAGSFDAVQDLLGQTGARVNRLDLAGANVDALDTNLRSFRSDLSEVEFEEALTQLIARQTAYQAALTSTSRMLSTTLADYL